MEFHGSVRFSRKPANLRSNLTNDVILQRLFTEQVGLLFLIALQMQR